MSVPDNVGNHWAEWCLYMVEWMATFRFTWRKTSHFYRYQDFPPNAEGYFWWWARHNASRYRWEMVAMTMRCSHFVFQNVERKLFGFGLVEKFYFLRLLNDFADLLPSLDFALATHVWNHSLKPFYFTFQSERTSDSLPKKVEQSIFKGW